MLKYQIKGEKEISSWRDVVDLVVDERADGVYYLKRNGVCSYLKISGFKDFFDSEFVLVGFSGAVNQKNATGPFFSYQSMANKISIPLISFSDPSLLLSEDLSLGWFLGNDRYPDYAKDICDFLDFFIEKSKKKIILSGGSGGGFASLNVVNNLDRKESAIAVVWNPQIIVNNYNSGAVEGYLSSCCKTLPSFRESEVTFKGARSVVMMDGLDHAHLRLHLRYYLEKQGAPKKHGSCYLYEKTKVIVGDWGTGHSAPPKWLIEQQLKNVIMNWPDIIFDDGLSFNKSVVDFSCKGFFERLKGCISLKAYKLKNSLLVDFDLSKEYVGYQLRFKVYNECGEAIASSRWLRSHNGCSFEITIQDEEVESVSKWQVSVILED